MSKQKIMSENKRYLALVLMMVVLVVVFSIASSSFFSVGTLKNYIRQNAVLFIASMGMMFTMLTGGLDLSVGSTGALCGMIAAITMTNLGMEGVGVAIAGILIAVLVGVIMGLINGFLIGYLGISPFMTTLATMSIARGATIAISGNSRVSVDNPVYNALGSYVFKIGPVQIPASLLLVIAVIIFSYILLNKLSFGRKVYAVGGNRTAATASGINSKKTIMLTYVICSVFMALSSIIWIGRTMSAVPRQGEGLEFDVLTAIIIGGIALSGGFGKLKGALIGAGMFGIISVGVSMIDSPPYVIYWIKGGLIIAAVYLDIRMKTAKVKKTAAKGEAQTVVSEASRGNKQKIMDIIAENKQEVLELKNITKEFPGVKALDNVSLKITRGKVHAIMGENGAGKSTLMKILTGVYSKDAGEICINGIPVNIGNPIEAQQLGISIIYQEFALVQCLTVAQNVFLGKEMPSKIKAFVDRKKMVTETTNILKKVNLDVDPTETVGVCTVGQQQMVEIGKAVGANSWVVVMDEPTSALTEDDKDKLFKIIEDLKAQGVAIVYISHRMSEIFAIADEVTVLRDGQHVISAPIEEMNEDLLVRYMVGRQLTDVFSRKKAELKDVVLEVKDLKRDGVFDPISFSVRAGEVLGFSGLMGAGRTEIMRCLFGLDKYDGGEIYLNGKRLNIKSPNDAIREKICLVSEDRRREGIVPLLSIRENMTIPSLKELCRGGFVNVPAEMALSEEYIEKLAIKTPSMEQAIGNLSGGNQQKVCLAKWLAVKPDVIILDEPTRGIDVGAKAEIHKIIEQLANDGMAIILISSELPEIMGACDRIIVLYEGEKKAEYIMDESVTQEMIMQSAAGMY